MSEEHCENGCDLKHYHSHQGAPYCLKKPNADDEPRPEIDILRAKLKVAEAGLEQFTKWEWGGEVNAVAKQSS